MTKRGPKPGRKPQRPFTVDDARRWFGWFGHDTTCISPTGREMFLVLLEELKRRGAFTTPGATPDA